MFETLFSYSWSTRCGYQKLNDIMNELKEFVNNECSEFTALDVVDAIK